MQLLQEGQIIRDTYEVERYLGEGAFAEVYRVKHRFLGRQAMKVFKVGGMTLKETEEMLGEALMLSRIGHPHIVRVFEANVTEIAKRTYSFFTMEYVAGGSLEKFWRSYGAQMMPVDTAVEIVRQVCLGLAVAHGEKPPIIHRDIKPQNILVGYDAEGLRVRVSDFGLAKRVNPLTFLASARGTPRFKAPEAFRELNSDSRAGDVWGLGSTLYLLLTDRIPYTEPGREDALHNRFGNKFRPASELNLQIDSQLDGILARTLALDPKDRYPSAIELLKDVSAWAPPVKRPAQPSISTTSLEFTKIALGRYSPVDASKARHLAAAAVELAKQAGRLAEAKEMLEEALNTCPDLREQFEYRLKLWHRGITM